LDKPIELKPLDPKDKEALDSGDSGSMLDDLKGATKLKRAVPELPAGPESEVRKLYQDYKDKVIGDNDPTDEQMKILEGIADRLLEK
jgi:hypothetical protein